jgi:hypothetical protein
MTLKNTLLQELESVPESLLAEALNFIRFLKTQQTVQPESSQILVPDQSAAQSLAPQTLPHPKPILPYRPASGRSLLRHVGTWQGDDFETCLQSVYATRSKAKFDDSLDASESG